MTTNDNEFYLKKPTFFYCENCDFKCSYKRDYERHINTKKHKNNEITTFDNGFYLKKPDLKNFTCEFCDKVYIWFYFVAFRKIRNEMKSVVLQKT